jgi:hypothetical protein
VSESNLEQGAHCICSRCDVPVAHQHAELGIFHCVRQELNGLLWYRIKVRVKVGVKVSVKVRGKVMVNYQHTELGILH